MRRLAVLPLLLMAVGCEVSSDDDSGDDSGGGFAAEVMCEEFVKQQLKAPGSADFSEQQHNEVGEDKWRVVGVVDSENSFGAKLRADYACELKYVGDDEWRASNVEVIPRD